MKKSTVISLIIIVIALLLIGYFQSLQQPVLVERPTEPLKEVKTKKTNGLIMLIEFEEIKGVWWWEKQLDQRNLNALVSVQKNILEKCPETFKRLAEKGYEIAGNYGEAPFWDMPYDRQFQIMKETKELVEKVTGKPMRIFSSRYFAYDENTLKAADALGIEYVLARGTKGVEAIVYSPLEYKVKIISISNVPFEEMGTGSLCDYSLWARGASSEDFGKVVEGSIEMKPTNMILVSHAYLGGTRIDWWKVYEKALSSDKVSWKKFNDWINNLTPLKMKNSEIPLNKEVKYEVPKPAVPIEDLELIPGLEELESQETFSPVCY